MSSFYWRISVYGRPLTERNKTEWNVSNHVTKYEKHGDFEKPYQDERIRK